MQIYSFIWKIKRNFAGQIREKRANNVQKCCPIKRNELKERCSSGWRGTPGKRVTGETGSQVRILFSPQEERIQSSEAKALGLFCSLRKIIIIEHRQVFFFYVYPLAKLVCSWRIDIKKIHIIVFFLSFARAPAASKTGSTKSIQIAG